MFDDLDATLGELLSRELPSSWVKRVGISFATPGGDFPTTSVTLPAVNLFLYEILENKDLRNRDPIQARAGGRLDASASGPGGQVPPGTVLQALAPVRVDCHYLVTAWGNPQDDHPETSEHRLLGYVLRALLRHREIPASMLQGSLKRQPLPVRTAAIQSDAQKPRGDFWQALGGKPRACFDYRVTVCVELGELEEVGPSAWESVVLPPSAPRSAESP